MEKSIVRIINAIAIMLALVGWLAGVVLAKAGWWKVGAIFMPPLAWYFLVERLMQIMGLAP